MSEIRISVALASYNGEKYIREQIDSILANLSEEDEIVVSDDGSTDGTLAILKEYQNAGVNLTVVNGPKKGIKQNIGNALSYCKGRYIFMADQDDVWTGDKVEKVLAVLGKNGCRLVNHDAKVMNGDLTEVLMESFFAYRGSKAGFFANFVKNRYMGCCMAFERELLELALPIPNEIEMHDQWLGMLNDWKKGGSVFLPEQLLYYRRHDENVSDFSHGTVIEMIKKRLTLLRALRKRRKQLKCYKNMSK